MQSVTTLLGNLPYLNPLSGGVDGLAGPGRTAGCPIDQLAQVSACLEFKNWGILVALIVAAPLTALFFDIKVTAGNPLPMPVMPADAPGSTMMVLSAIPWTLAGGLLGPVAAAGIGILSGLFQGVWDTHSIFTVIELGLMGVLFAVATRQRYRTSIFRLLRMPVFSALCLVLVHAFLFVLGGFFTALGTASISQRLDYAFSNLGVVSLAFGGEMLVAGLVAQLVSSSRRWGKHPSPPALPGRKKHRDALHVGYGLDHRSAVDPASRR